MIDISNFVPGGPSTAPSDEEEVRTFPVKIKKGYFPADGSGKLPAGTECELPEEEAVRVIRAGIADRADALPGVEAE